jgi:hypothetical protein
MGACETLPAPSLSLKSSTRYVEKSKDPSILPFPHLPSEKNMPVQLPRPTVLTTVLGALLILQVSSQQQRLLGQATGCTDGHYQCSPGCPGCQAFIEGAAPAPVVTPIPEDEATAEEGTGVTPSPTAQAPMDALAAGPGLPSSFGATAAGLGGVPDMVGDFFGFGYNYAAFNNATATPAGGDRILKRAENYYPFPVDRVFFNFHHFHNALIDTQGITRDLDRYTFGIEKAFYENLLSLELRIPFAGTIAAVQDVINPDTDATEFGNLSLALKGLLYRNDRLAVAGGLGIVFPTGDDSAIVDSLAGSGNPVTQIVFTNESYVLQPFVGVYLEHTPRLFSQFLTQLYFDVTGNDVIVPVGSSLSTSSVDEVSTLTSQSLLFLDYQVGYWLHRDACARCLTGIAPIVELHYTTAMQDLDLGSFAGRGIFVEDLRRDVLNLTGGVYLELGNMSALKVAGVAPLRDGTDKLFDAELGVQYVRRF